MTNSDQKGKVGEREACHLLEEYGYKAMRSAQNSGVADDEHSADILTTVPGLRFEVKRTEKDRYKIWHDTVRNEWISQAKQDAGEGYDWMILWREDYGEWTAVCDLGGVLVRTTDIQEVIDIKSNKNGPVNWPGE